MDYIPHSVNQSSGVIAELDTPEENKQDLVHVTLRLPLEQHRQATARMSRFGGKFQWLLHELVTRWLNGDIDLNKPGQREHLTSQGLSEEEADVIRAIRNPVTRDERMLRGVIQDWLEIKKGE